MQLEQIRMDSLAHTHTHTHTHTSIPSLKLPLVVSQPQLSTSLEDCGVNIELVCVVRSGAVDFLVEK